jgi:hypothetical protein
MPVKQLTNSAVNPSFKPPHNPSPPSMVLTPLTISRYRPLPPPQHSTDKYIWQAPPSDHPTPFPLDLALSLALLRSHAELKPPQLYTIIVLPLCQRLCPGEHPSSTTLCCLSYSAIVSKHRRPLAPVRCRNQCPHLLLVHYGPDGAASPQHRGHGSWVFMLEQNLEIR